MITTVLCYSATSGIAVADYGKPCRVDMGNVGLISEGNHPGHLIGDHSCNLDVRSGDGVQGGV